MDRLLEQIRGVVGVVGVAVYCKPINQYHKRMPSKLEDEELEIIEKGIKLISSNTESHVDMKLKFDRGWLVIRTINDFMVLILAREELSFDTLNLVLKATLGTVSATSESKSKSPLAEFSPRMAHNLLEAMNVVASHFAEKIGAFSIADLLRKSKTYLVKDFPILKHVIVDNNGSVALIRGSEKHLSPVLVDAVAWWCYCFKEEVNCKTPVVGFDIKRVTSEVEYNLAPLGFYVAYHRAATQAVNFSNRLQ